MTQNFDKLYSQIISEAKIKNKGKQSFEYVYIDDYYSPDLGIKCPVCGTTTKNVRKFGDTYYFTCRYFPRCHGRAPFIDINSSDPEDIKIIENAKQKCEEEKAEAERIKQEKAEEEKRKQEEYEARIKAEKQKLIADSLNPENKMIIYTVEGRIGSWNSALDDYHTYREVIQYVETLGDKNIYNVYSLKDIKTHYADNIPYKTDKEFTTDIEGTAYSLVSDPTTIFYKGTKWALDKVYSDESEVYDSYQPSTYGT